MHIVLAALLFWLHAQGPEYRLTDLARLEYQDGHYQQAEKLFKQALAAVGTDDLSRAEVLLDLGTLYLDEERLVEAEEAYLKALKIYRKSEQPSQTALLLRHLGAVYSIQRRPGDAQKALNEAQDIAKKKVPEDIGLRISILNSLGVAHYREGNTGRSEKLFRQAIELIETDESRFINELTTVLNNMGAVRLARRDFTRAEPLLTRALSLTEARFGAAHPTVSYTLNTLGVLYLGMRRYAEAEKHFQRAVTILDQNGFAFDIRLARALKGLSEARLKENKNDKAEEALRRAVPIARKSLTTHPDMAAILEAYSNLLKSQGKSDEARQLSSEAQRARMTMALTVRAYTPD